MPRPPKEAPHPFSPANPLASRDDLSRAFTTGFLDPLLPHMPDPAPSIVTLGHTGTHYDATAAALEGFARPLWGLAALLTQESYAGAERWTRGLASGTDPEGPGYWGMTRDRDQRMVEMSPIGFSLAMSAEAPEGRGVWAGLSERERENVGRWMGGINEKEMPETNWLWFRVFANLGLSKVGLPHNPARMLKDLDHLDTFYLGDGWSRDGPVGVRQLDYYSGSFAIQYAQLVYSRLAAASDPARSKEYKQRAAAFAVDFLRYYDPHTGAAIPFGRSTTYRMAMGAFWAALAWAFTPEDYAALLPAALADPGVVKGLLLRSLRWWAAHHATIFAGDGTLTIGYVYPNMHFTENYNSPGSPYWATKAFLVLGMPATAPFWAAAEKPFPAFGAIGGRVRRIAHPLHISVHAPRHTYLLSTGQACHYPLKATQAKYGKFSYSARFGFCVPTGSYMLDQHALDGMLGFSADGGETWRSRRIVEGPGFESYTAPGGGDWPVLTGTWDVFGDGDARLTTWLVPPSGGESHYHLRVHKLVILPNSGKGKGFGGKILSAEGGWAVYGQGEDGRTLAPYTRASNEGRENGDGYAFAVSSGGVVGVREIVPTAAKRTSEVLNVDANASLIWPRTVLPTLRGEHDAVKGGVEWFVTAIYGRATREDEDGYEGDSVDGGKKRKRGSEEPEEREREREWESEWREVDGNGWHKLLPEELRVQVMLATV